MIKKILSVILYALPVLFFTICYFLVVTSGEDIFQGANSMPDIIGDSIAAFNHSARLADMYAWSTINFFDYTFQFGPDIIFRIIDIALGFLTFYLTAFIALGRRPRLELKDATIFAGSFLLVMFTSYGTTLYGGFSKIHNYLIISVVCLTFGLFYFKDLLGQKLPEKLWFAFVMLALGFIFGLTSSVTAVAFLICLPVYLIYLHLTKQKVFIKRFLLSWRSASVLGVIVALFCIYVIGPGLADYDTNAIYRAVCDYLPLNEIFINLGDSIKRIIFHNLFNFGRFLAPFVVISIPVAVYGFILRRKNKYHFPKFSRKEKNYIFATLCFIILHILALSQIKYFTRMVLPVHLAAIALYCYVLLKVFKLKNFIPLALIETALLLIILTIRTVFAISYLNQVSPVLERIKNSEEEVTCITEAEAKSYNLPYIYLGQEDFLVDWAMPQTIYGKKVDFCNSNDIDTK